MNRSFKRTRCVPRCACIDYSTPAKPSAFHQASEEKETLAFTRHWVGLWHHATGNVLTSLSRGARNSITRNKNKFTYLVKVYFLSKTFIFIVAAVPRNFIRRDRLRSRFLSKTAISNYLPPAKTFTSEIWRKSPTLRDSAARHRYLRCLPLWCYARHSHVYANLMAWRGVSAN